jgi:hypothetical protein
MIVRELESCVVPSVMVLVLGKDSSLSRVADAVVAGAKGVRFTEVVVRAMEPSVFRYRQLDAETSVRSFDGIVVVAPESEASSDALAVGTGRAPLTNTVVASASADASLSAALVATGGIVVSAPKAESAEEYARAIGARVAKVAGWVRHSLGHEAEGGHGHHHDGGEHHHGHHHHHDHGDEGSGAQGTHTAPGARTDHHH